MGKKMNRGKQQVLFNYLPGKTFDFEGGTISRVSSIRGLQRNDLNIRILLLKIAEDARAWPEEFRPVLADRVLNDASRFVLLEPKNVEAELFPKVFWCDNRNCGQVVDYSNREQLPPSNCRVCRTGKLVQLRFVKIHRCGRLEPLSPALCQRCRTSNHMALDTRGSERISNFRWICRNPQCNNTKLSLFPGSCRECQWPGEDNMRNMKIQVHRAGPTFYTHTTTLLNIPDRELDRFLSLPESEWSALAAAKFFGMPEVVNRPLSDFAPTSGATTNQQAFTLSVEQEQGLRDRGFSDQQIIQFREMQAQLQTMQVETQPSSSPRTIAQALEQRTGVPLATWQHARQEMLEAVMPFETGHPSNLFDQPPNTNAIQTAQRMGLSRLALVTDFPMIVATYAYSRAESAPRRDPQDPVQCRLNPFPPQRDYDGKLPIYVDEVRADALLLSLNPERVHTWLERNNLQPPDLPRGSDINLSRRAYFVQLFNDVPLRETLQANRPQARMVFGLLHTLSHLCVRQVALLCGLDRTSLSEYLLPRTLTFAIYCNHRFGATIGALTALFEQSLAEWLNAVRDARRCVYDPVCREREASCHACTHLAETSCRFFNLNLGRSFLFGGYDRQLQRDIQVGYFDPSLL